MVKKPVLVLQYPDNRKGRTVALAATSNPHALAAFRNAVLDEARLETVGLGKDEVLLAHEHAEVERLIRVLDLLIPEANDYG